MSDELLLFQTWMQRGSEAYRNLLENTAASLEELYPDEAVRLRGTDTDWDIDQCEYGMLGSRLMKSMGAALDDMPAIEFEPFYQGYVEWAKGLLKCGYRGKEEENARGAMLMALRNYKKEPSEKGKK